MTLLEKVDSFDGKKSNNKPLMRSSIDFKDHQFYIYLTDMDIFNYILILANSQLVVLYIIFRTDNQDL